MLLATRNGTVTVPPTPADVVCGLGAEDAFAGARSAGRAPEGWEQRAKAAGAVTASRPACDKARPTIEELDNLMGAPR